MPDLTFTLRKDSEGIFHATFRKHGEKASQRVSMKTLVKETATRRATMLGEHFALMETLKSPNKISGDI